MYRALAVGAIAGVVTALVRVRVGGGTLDAWVNSIGAWLVVPFVAGALTKGRRRTAVAGVLASLAQLAVFYAIVGLERPAAIAFWCACAVGGGVTFGLAGGLARRQVA